jgi:hypothetical protein
MVNGRYSKGPLYSQKQLDKVQRLLELEGFLFAEDNTSLGMRIFTKRDAVYAKGSRAETGTDKGVDMTEIAAAIAKLKGNAPPSGPVIVPASVFPLTQEMNRQAAREAAEAAAKVPPRIIKSPSCACIYLDELGCDPVLSGTMLINRVGEDKSAGSVVWEYAKRKEPGAAKNPLSRFLKRATP